ncbi:MAG: diaminopimelate decarboxylase [Clostridiales bacterium]|nr:diaminopimelate decarboxylase [Clostridiales bacterium]
MKLFGTMKIQENELTIGGIKVTELAKKYGTPLYIMDEELIRSTCREYSKYFIFCENKDLVNNRVIYAGKAFLNIEMVKIIEEEGLYLDVVSGGELMTAYKGNFDMSRVYFHGNNKSKEEIELGIAVGVGTFVVDNFYELRMLNEISKKYNKIQKVLLRVIPEVNTNTHKSIKTGERNSKFGFPLEREGIIRAVEETIIYENIELAGLHSHIGSQIFGLKSYYESISIMLRLIDEIERTKKIKIKELDIGGGFGIYYVDGDKPEKIKDICISIIEWVKKECSRFKLDIPMLSIEPGRSIVGNAGITLYEIGSIKKADNNLKIIAIDGGMYENIRPALYDSKYEYSIGNKINIIKTEKVQIVGKCCESGDVLVKRGYLQLCKEEDILVLMSTGAYGYSMASNYNRMLKPAVISVKNGESKIMVRRQTYDDIVKNDIF